MYTETKLGKGKDPVAGVDLPCHFIRDPWRSDPVTNYTNSQLIRRGPGGGRRRFT